MTIAITITRERNVNGHDVEEEFEVSAECDFIKSSKGARDSLGGKRGAGPQLEPDTDAEIVINEVTDVDGNEVELTKTEEQRVIETGFEMQQAAANDSF